MSEAEAPLPIIGEALSVGVDSGASEPKITYTAAEWSAVERAVQPPLRPLGVIELGALLMGAYEYGQSGTTGQVRQKQRRLWKRFGCLCAEAERAFVELTAPLIDANFYNADYKERLAELRRLRALADEYSSVPWLRSVETLRAKLPPESFRLVTKYASPRVKYYQCVLDVWTEVGGELKFSQNSDEGGPLWRFFKAVAKPVMGRRMPARSGFRDIINRAKRERAALELWHKYCRSVAPREA